VILLNLFLKIPKTKASIAIAHAQFLPRSASWLGLLCLYLGVSSTLHAG